MSKKLGLSGLRQYRQKDESVINSAEKIFGFVIILKHFAGENNLLLKE
jgi:hypothetical protein